MMMMMMMMMMMVMVMMMIASVEQRPGWGEHVKTNLDIWGVSFLQKVVITPSLQFYHRIFIDFHGFSIGFSWIFPIFHRISHRIHEINQLPGALKKGTRPSGPGSLDAFGLVECFNESVQAGIQIVR